MLGAIIGDIIGSRWEFNPTNDYHSSCSLTRTVLPTIPSVQSL